MLLLLTCIFILPFQSFISSGFKQSNRHRSGVAVVEFEQVNVSWYKIYSYCQDSDL